MIISGKQRLTGREEPINEIRDVLGSKGGEGNMERVTSDCLD